jgi:hypothetical protein
VRTQILIEKISSDEPEGRGTDYDRIRRCESLNTSRHVVGSVIRSELFLAAATTHIAYDHQPGVDTDADRQLHPIVLRQTDIERSQRLYHVEASPHGSSGIILMRLGITKVDQ